ncbi:MAG: hypothetical protein ACE5Q6_05305 [Dehalococcoidia bacterium]
MTTTALSAATRALNRQLAEAALAQFTMRDILTHQCEINTQTITLKV